MGEFDEIICPRQPHDQLLGYASIARRLEPRATEGHPFSRPAMVNVGKTRGEPVSTLDRLSLTSMRFRIAPQPGSHRVEGFYVGGTVEDGDEQARLVLGGSVKHGLTRREMAERSWTDDLVVDRKPAFENYDGLGSGMSMLWGKAVHGACGATLGRVQIGRRLELPNFFGRGRSR